MSADVDEMIYSAKSGAKEGYQELLDVCSKWGDFTKTFYSSICLVSEITCNLEGLDIVEGNRVYALQSTEESIEFVFEKIRECIGCMKSGKDKVEKSVEKENDMEQ